MKHKDKIKLARKMAGVRTKDGVVHTPSSNLFLTKAWQMRKDSIAKKVIDKIKKIKLTIKKQK